MENELPFKSLIENSFDGLTLFDADGKILYLSPVNQKIDGYSAGEQMGKNGFERVHPDDLEEAKKIFFKLVKTPGEKVSITLRLLHKNGHYMRIECHAVNLLKDHTVKAIAVHFCDITDRYEAEKKLKESEKALRLSHDLLSLFVKNAPMLTYLKTVKKNESRVLFASENFMDLIGIPGSAMTGKNMYELFPEEFAAKITANESSTVPAVV